MRTSADKSSVAAHHFPERLTSEIFNDSQSASSRAESRSGDVQDGLCSTNADATDDTHVSVANPAPAAHHSPEGSTIVVAV